MTSTMRFDNWEDSEGKANGIINTDTVTGGRIFVGTTDPSTLVDYTVAVGDVWIEVPA